MLKIEVLTLIGQMEVVAKNRSVDYDWTDGSDCCKNIWRRDAWGCRIIREGGIIYCHLPTGIPFLECQCVCTGCCKQRNGYSERDVWWVGRHDCRKKMDVCEMQTVFCWKIYGPWMWSPEVQGKLHVKFLNNLALYYINYNEMNTEYCVLLIIHINSKL